MQNLLYKQGLYLKNKIRSSQKFFLRLAKQTYTGGWSGERSVSNPQLSDWLVLIGETLPESKSSEAVQDGTMNKRSHIHIEQTVLTAFKFHFMQSECLFYHLLETH